MHFIKTGRIDDDFVLIGYPELRYTPMGEAEIAFYLITEKNESYTGYVTGNADKTEKWIEEKYEEFATNVRVHVKGEWKARKGMDGKQHNYARIDEIVIAPPKE